jgi:hypothetical protein
VAAAEARLALASVDPELGLHLSGGAVGVSVIAQSRALAGNASPERALDSAHQRFELRGIHVAGRAQRVEARPPQRLVRVDVPNACEDALVEDNGLQGRAPACEAVDERSRRERPAERLDADLGREVRLEVRRLELEPGAEAPHVPVCDIRSVV